MSWASMHLNACDNGCDLMEFYRVNENLVKCLVTEEDMEQYDVKIEDFFSKSENALLFIQEVVKMAAKEVDYRPNGLLTSLQIAPIPENGIAIFMAENNEMDTDVTLRLLKKAGVKIPEEVMKEIGKIKPGERAGFVKKLMKNIQKEIAKDMGVNQDDALYEQSKITDLQLESTSNLERKIFAFDSVGDVLSYVNAVEMPEEIESSLYKDPIKGKFYMLLVRKDVSVQTLAGVYLTAYEYGQFVSEKEEQAEYIKEHYECVIAENAIGKLKR